MFANRYTAFIDACSLAKVLPRNLLLTLAEAEFFRIRWSARILAETERAIARILIVRGRAPEAATSIAAEQIARMRRAFAEAEIADFDHLLSIGHAMPDPEDAHVLAAAVKAEAATIVTENLKHFPADLLASVNLEARSADEFIADTLALDIGRAVAAIRKMRLRFNRPEKTASALLLDMEAAGLVLAVDSLRPHLESI